ncbi:MAG: OsmC family protein [Flavobacterium sp.]
MEKHSYNLSLEWTGDRKGLLSSPEFSSTVEVVTPPEFDKGISGYWSPEHLFTASVLSCFMTTFLAIADYSKLEFEKFECKAEGILETIEGKFLMTEIILKPIVYIKNSEEIEKTERILNKSEKACLISNSIITKVFLNFQVKVL